MKLLTLDFETKDPFIGEDLGGGWTYALNHGDIGPVEHGRYQLIDERLPEKKLFNKNNIHFDDTLITHSFKVLGAGIRDHKGQALQYITDKDILRTFLESHDGLIMHNAMYDYGILCYLFPNLMKEKNFFIYDTAVMARVLYSNSHNYHLKGLAKKFKVTQKSDDELLKKFCDSGLYTMLKFAKTGMHYKNPFFDGDGEEVVPKNMSEIKTLMYKNLDLMSDDDVGQYCLDDVKATHEIFEKMIDNFQELSGSINEESISDLIKICIKMRIKGIRVDLEKAEKLSTLLRHKYNAAAIELYHMTGKFNVNSSSQCAEVLIKLGMDLPMTENGTPSVTKPWLEKQDNSICKQILMVRKYNKIKRDYVDKILEVNEMLKFSGQKYGRIYSELVPFGASTTGRFSSRGINMQQIPKRDQAEIGIVRSIMLPEKGEKWASGDFSNQEQRLQVHFADLLQCEGIKSLVTQWNDDPRLDFHGKVAEMAGITRPEAKIINLGLSYGMGAGKLCKNLGYKTYKSSFTNERGQIIIYDKPSQRGKEFLEKYHKLFPFLKTMKLACERYMKNSHYIKTLGGRKLKPQKPYDHRNALNWMIQGSAADQAILSIIAADKLGLNILSVIHDEINISYRDEKDLEKLRQAMEESIKIGVPTVVDIGTGPNWGDCK